MTKTEYLLDRISDRLGVPKPAEDQVDFAPEPIDLLRGLGRLVDLLAESRGSKEAYR